MIEKGDMPAHVCISVLCLEAAGRVLSNGTIRLYRLVLIEGKWKFDILYYYVVFVVNLDLDFDITAIRWW